MQHINKVATTCKVVKARTGRRRRWYWM